MIKKADEYQYDRTELVSVGSALHLAMNSYLKGCVDILQAVDVDQQLERGEAYMRCRDLTEEYMQDILYIMDQEAAQAPDTSLRE